MKALIPCADGVEEMELVITADVLRRAGWEVVIAGLKPGVVIASRGVKIVPDAEWGEVDPSAFDALILPGGAVGTRHLCEHAGVQESVRSFDRARKLLAAICAAPLALQTAGVLKGRRATCHPAVRPQLTEAQYVEAKVVEDDHLVTGAGPGAAFDFALALVARVNGAARAETLAREMVLR